MRISGSPANASVPFAHGPNFAGEPEFFQILEERLADVAEDGMAAQKFDFFAGEIYVLQEIQNLLEACGNQVVAAMRKMADE